MHSRELVELAALASAHAPALLRSGTPFLAIEGLGQYWASSRCRLDRWSRVLRDGKSSEPPVWPQRGVMPQSRGEVSQSPAHLKSVLEEILTSEVLTRVWTAVLAAFDERHHCQENAPVARTILAGHAEARRQALGLLLRGPGISSYDALALNRLRRRAERWTDLLVGHLAMEHDVAEYSANPELAREFAEDLRYQRGWAPGGQAWPLAMASMRASFSAMGRAANGDLNRQIAAGVLGCLPTEMFDSTGLLQSLWMARIQHAADDAQGLISEMFAAESPSAADPSAAPLRGLVARPERRRFGG